MTEDPRISLIRRGQIVVGATVIAALTLYGNMWSGISLVDRDKYISYLIYFGVSFSIMIVSEGYLLTENSKVAGYMLFASIMLYLINAFFFLSFLKVVAFIN